MGRNKLLLKNSIYFMIGNLGSKVIQLLMLPLYTKWMSPASYGVIDLLNNYVNVLVLFLGLDVADALIVFPLKKSKKEVKEIFSTSVAFMVFTIIVALLLFLCIHVTGVRDSLGAFGENLWLVFGILISNAIGRLFQYFCRGINKMKVFCYTGIVSSCLIAGFSFAFIPNFGFKGYLIAIILSNIITALFVMLYSKSVEYFDIKLYSRKTLHEMLKYSIPMIPNILLWWIILSLNRPLLEKYVGLAAIGLFGIACKIPDIMGIIYNFFHSAWITTVSEEYGKSDFNNYVNSVLEIATSVQTFVYLGIMALYKYLFQWLIDEQYWDAMVYVPLLCVGIVLSNFATFLSSIFNANRKTNKMFYSVVMAAIVCLILNFALIPKYGIWGACVSILFGHLIAGLTRIFFTRDSFSLLHPYHLILNVVLCSVCASMYVFEKETTLLWFLMLVISFVINWPQINMGSKMLGQLRKQ